MNPFKFCIDFKLNFLQGLFTPPFTPWGSGYRGIILLYPAIEPCSAIVTWISILFSFLSALFLILIAFYQAIELC